MAALVYQKNKESGVIYVYESVSRWDKEKKQSRAKRKCIGKLDPETKKIIQTEKRKPKSKNESISKRFFHGATFLFDQLGLQLGLTDDLKKCFPDTYKQILSIVYYLILEDKNSLSRFNKWSSLHIHPFGSNLSSQRISELFSSIREGQKDKFFKLQGKRREKEEYWAYDITSISSYSQVLKQVKYGNNKENDRLPQINLALLFGEKSMLPFYYRKLAGNISDVKTVKKLIQDIDFLKQKKTKLVMDRGFYSSENVNNLYKNHIKFLMGTKLSLKYVKAELDKVREEIKSWNNFSEEFGVYAKTTAISWDYKQNRPYKGDLLEEKRRMYLHFYHSIERASEEEKKHNMLLLKLQNEIKSGKLNPKNEILYKKYFSISSTPVKGIKITAKEEAIRSARKNYGYFALISNEIKDPLKALAVYRNKDVVEKAFENLKDRLSFRRVRVSSEQSLDGKIFVEFIALIYLSHIKKVMRENKLNNKHTTQTFLDEFDIIECYQRTNKKIKWGEITKKQMELFKIMKVSESSLQ